MLDVLALDLNILCQLDACQWFRTTIPIWFLYVKLLKRVNGMNSLLPVYLDRGDDNLSTLNTTEDTRSSFKIQPWLPNFNLEQLPSGYFVPDQFIQK